MAGFKIRYKVRFEDGTLRTLTATSHRAAKKTFISRYAPPKGSELIVWPDESDARMVGIASEKRRMRV